MKKSRIVVLVAVCMALVFSSCAAAPSGMGDSSMSMPVSSMSEPSSSLPSSSAPPSSAPRDPNMPPQEAFLPQAPNPAPRYGEPDANQTPIKAAPGFRQLGSFDGLAYSVIDYGIYSSIQAALYGEDDVFFLFGVTLYYSDAKSIYHVMDNVYRIAGSDRDGIYLVVEDLTVTPLTGSSPYSTYPSASPQSSLVYFNPVTGAVLQIKKDVANGVVAGENHDVLFFTTPEQHTNELGYRFAVYRRNLQTKQDSYVFVDDCVETTPHYPKGPYAADTVVFHQDGGDVRMVFEYAFPSEYPYERSLTVGYDGTVSGDSETAEVVVADKGYLTTTLHKNKYTYNPNPDAVEIGGYPLRVAKGGVSEWTLDYFIEQNGGELYWRWNTHADIAPDNGLLYSYSEGPVAFSGEAPVTVYNGAYVWAVEF